MAIALAVTLVARDGESERVAEGLLTLQDASRQEPGCRAWIAHRSAEDRDRFFLYELFDDDDALGAHREAPHYLRYHEDIIPLLTGRDRVVYRTLDEGG